MGEKERIIGLIKKIVNTEEKDIAEKHSDTFDLQEAVSVADRINIVIKKESDALDILRELRDLLVIPTKSVRPQLRSVKLLEVLVSNCRVLRAAVASDIRWNKFLYSLVVARYNKPDSREAQTALLTAIAHWANFSFSSVDNEDKLFDQFMTLYAELTRP